MTLIIGSFGTILTLLSAVFFPWPLTAFLALGVAPFEPLVPLAAGILVDTLYYSSSSGSLPLFTIYGALATALAFFVRSRLKTGIIGE